MEVMEELTRVYVMNYGVMDEKMRIIDDIIWCTDNKTWIMWYYYIPGIGKIDKRLHYR